MTGGRTELDICPRCRSSAVVGWQTSVAYEIKCKACGCTLRRAMEDRARREWNGIDRNSRRLRALAYARGAG